MYFYRYVKNLDNFKINISHSLMFRPNRIPFTSLSIPMGTLRGWGGGGEDFLHPSFAVVNRYLNRSQWQFGLSFLLRNLYVRAKVEDRKLYLG
jgi:hypothetical protein